MSNTALQHVWTNSQQKGSALLVLIALADSADEGGICYPGIKYIAAKCRMTERYAQMILQKLQAAGEVSIELGQGIKTGHGSTNRYRIPMGQGKPSSPVKKANPQPSSPPPELITKQDSPAKTGNSQPSSPRHSDEVNSLSPQEMKPAAPHGVNSASPKPSVEPLVKPKAKRQKIAPSGDPAIFARYWSMLVKAKICEQVSRIRLPETKNENPVAAETPKPPKWRANDPQIQAAVADAFKVSVGGFAGTLAQQLLGQHSGKNTRRDQFLIEPGMFSPAEIVLFGGWYRDHYEFSPKPSTDAERIAELVAEFRSQPAHFFANNLPRAEARLRQLLGQADPMLMQLPTDPEYAARIERVYARIAALKGSLV